MYLNIQHTTKYQYDTPVTYSLQQVRLTPKERIGQSVVNWQTTIEGGNKELEFTDEHNNHVVLVSIEAGRSDISISSKGEVKTSDTQGVIGQNGGYMPLWLFMRSTELTLPGKGIAALAKDAANGGEPDVGMLHRLSGQISDLVVYKTGTTDATTTAENAIIEGRGVCQDHAHIFIASARSLGFPARYVSGYLMMDDRVDQDASHAWAEAYVNGIGWIGFDVSNGISPDERYVAIATGLDYRDAAPISGLRLGESLESMSVSLQVQQ